MGLPDPTQVLRGVAGRLAVAPTNLGTAFPHGGTALGYVREIFLRPSAAYYLVRAEEYGGEPVEVVRSGEAWVFACAVRSFDPDVIQRIFPATTIVSGRRRVDEPGTATEGTLLAATGIVIVFTPFDATYPAVLIHRAVPLIEESAAYPFALNRETTFPVAFRALRAADGRTLQIGRLADLTL